MNRKLLLTSLAVIAPLAIGVVNARPASAVDDVRYTLWMATTGVPQWSDIQASAGKDAVVVLNADRQWQAEALRRADPTVQLYQYRDLASVRSYDSSRAVVAGVSYQQAQQQDWLARDTNWNTIEWRPHPGHWQAKVWNPGYQDAWANGVSAQTRWPWNGVWADNDMTTLSWYTPALLAGTSSRGQTDQQIQGGVDAVIAKGGRALNNRGQSMNVNISEGRLNHGRWWSHSRFGGGTAEHFMNWSRDGGTADVWADRYGTWLNEAKLVEMGPRTLAITTAASWDKQNCIFGYTSFLMFASPGDAWQCAPDGRYDRRWSFPETDHRLGSPNGPAQQQGGAWVRSFQGGWVAVNPTLEWVSVWAPSGTRSLDGQGLRQVWLAPTTGVVTKR